MTNDDLEDTRTSQFLSALNAAGQNGKQLAGTAYAARGLSAFFGVPGAMYEPLPVMAVAAAEFVPGKNQKIGPGDTLTVTTGAEAKITVSPPAGDR